MINYICGSIVFIVAIFLAIMIFVVNKRTYICIYDDDFNCVCPVCNEIIPDTATKEDDTFYCFECGTKLRKGE